MARYWTLPFKAPTFEQTASAPAEFTVTTTTGKPCYAFDKDNDESIIISGVVPQEYRGTGTLKLRLYGQSSATSGAAYFEAVTEFHTPNENEDGNADNFGTANTANFTTEATANEEEAFNITLSNHGDAPAAGDTFRIKVTRDANNGSDTMAADWLCTHIEFFEEV